MMYGDRSTLGPTPASDGGCWFCQRAEGLMLFSLEWDTFVHEDCVRAELGRDPTHGEAVLMAREWGWS